MEILHIEARKKFKNINLEQLNKFSKKTISIAATVQYIDLIPQIKKYLEKKNNRIILKKGAYHKSQVLGCNPSAFDKSADILLLIADGKFYAKNNAIKLDKELYIFNSKTLEKITKQDIAKYQNKIKNKINKFFHFKKIGLIVSTKTGQQYNKATELKKKIEELDKDVYIFQTDTIALSELENFPQIKIWINTACYGLALDSNNILNYQDILKFFKS